MSGVRQALSQRGHILPLVASIALVAVTFLLATARSVPTAAAAAPAAAAAGTVVFIPAAAHAAGANGASWRTDVEVHNPGADTASFTIQLLVRDVNNASPQSKSYSLAPQRARRFTDVLMSEFGVDGAAALRVTVSSGSLLVTSRTYNLVGSNPWSLPQGSSFGQFEPGIAESDATAYGQEGRLIQLTQQPSSSLNGFRTNVGLVNTTAGAIDVRADFYRADGTWLGKKDGSDTNLPPYGFRQLNEVFGTWGTVTDGYAVVKTTTASGAFLAFATVIDNHNSGDPIFIPAARLTSGATTPTPTATTPAPTATPTRTPTPTPTSPAGKPNLYLYKPSAWPACFVANYQSGCCNTTSCCSPFLSTYYTTNFQVFVANSGAATATGSIRFAVAIDGTVKQYANYDNSAGIQPGYGVVLSWTYSDPVTAGTHSLTITVDPDNTISESNESDNSCATSASWTSIVLGHPAARAGAAPEIAEAREGERIPLARLWEPGTAAAPSSPLAAAASAPIYVPATAHAAGLNGASWRTDVEVHNPGTTAVTYTIALLKQATDNGGSVPTKTFSLSPQQSVRYTDVLSSVFATDGAAALRVTPQTGSLLVNSRTYNLIGPNSVGLPVGASFGQYVPGLDESSAIAYGEEARIIQLTHRDSSSLTDFRSNVGFVNTTAAPIDLRIDLVSAAGTLVGTIQDDRTHLRAYEFKQINGIFGEFTAWQDDGYAILRTTTSGGRFFAFATVIDNHLTGDPVFVPAQRVASSSAIVGSGTVGTAGGTVSGGGLTVTVPSGAFSQSVTLTILKGGQTTELDKFRTSEVFQLQGLPDVRANAITVTVDLTRSVSVTGADLVAVENEVYVPTAAALLSPPVLLAASRAGTKVTATIPAVPAGTIHPTTAVAPTASTDSYTIWAVTGYSALTTQQGHFYVRYPVTDVVVGGADEIGKGLEIAYTLIKDLGFDWSRRSTWPLVVSMEPFSADNNTRLAETVPSVWGINHYQLNVNTNRLTTQADIALMKDAAAHELFHLAQFLYDGRNRYTMAKSPGTWLWADEATSVWFENQFNGSAIRPQVVFENHAFMTKHGLEYPPGDPGTVQDHGYGAALLMRDLAKRKGNGAVGEFVRRKTNTQVLPVDAYDQQTGQSATSTWKLFMEEYAAAHLYTVFPTSADLWVASSGNRYTFAAAADTGTTFTWTAPDMSARFFGIQFTDKTWAAGTTVTLALTDTEGDAVSVVYTLRSGQLTKLGQHVNGNVFKVENAETFANNGTSLLVVVANGRAVRPYTGTTPITLRVSAGAHNEMKFNVPGVTCTSGLGLAMSFWNTFEPADLAWTGNTVKASFSGSIVGNDQTEYTGTATLSADRRTLLSLDFTYHSVALFNFSYCTPAGCRWEDWQSITWTGVGSAADWQPNEYHFSAAGVVARGEITAFSMREVRTGYLSASENFDCRFPIDETRVNEIRFDLWLTPP